MIINDMIIFIGVIILNITLTVMMMDLRELEEGRALEQGSGILPGLRAMVARAEVMLISMYLLALLVWRIFVLIRGNMCD